jgi:hypothetical protein
MLASGMVYGLFCFAAIFVSPFLESFDAGLNVWHGSSPRFSSAPTPQERPIGKIPSPSTRVNSFFPSFIGAQCVTRSQNAT